MDKRTGFPMKLKFGVQPKTTWYPSKCNIKLHMMDHPRGNFRARCVEMMYATWRDEPYSDADLRPDFCKIEFKKILQFQVLPNSLESLNFIFRVEGLTLIEVTHILRHRMLKAIHAQCSADRFLQEDSCFIPSSILQNKKFSERYMNLTEDCKQLYCDMVDSGEISILDARYILNRNHRYFYYFTIDLKTAMQFIQQRKCTQIQPEMDNIIAHKMYYSIGKIIPEFMDVVSLECDKRCSYITSSPQHSSRVFYPDSVHEQIIKNSPVFSSESLNKDDYLHRKKRKEMGVQFNPQDYNNEK